MSSGGGQVANGGSTERLLRAVEESARASGQIAELQRSMVHITADNRNALVAQGTVLEKIADTLARIEDDQKHGREMAVIKLEKRIDDRTKSGGWQAIAAWVFAGAAVIAAAALTVAAMQRQN